MPTNNAPKPLTSGQKATLKKLQLQQQQWQREKDTLRRAKKKPTKRNA